MTLVLKLNLYMVLIYHCAKKKVFSPSASKVTARTVRQTDRQTQRHDKNITSPHVRAVTTATTIMIIMMIMIKTRIRMGRRMRRRRMMMMMMMMSYKVTRSYKEKANSNRPIGPYKAVRYLT